MLQINMADVMGVINSVIPYLVAVGILLVLGHYRHRCRQQEDGDDCSQP